MNDSDQLQLARLRQSWNRSWNEIAASQPGDSYFHDLIARHSESWRKYHTLQHLEECLDLFESVRSLPDRPSELEIALWFHDAVYDVKASDNEEQSSRLARETLIEAGLSKNSIDRVESLIMITKHTTLPKSADEQWIVDIDLSIFAAPAARFAEYEQQVREEYAFVPLEIFQEKRAAILRSFLDRERIYSTEHFHALLETKARKNLMDSIEKLVGN